MKELTQETLQKYSLLEHEYHNTGKICCVGVQSSHLKRAGNAIMSRKDFLYDFCALEALEKWEKCECTIVLQERFLNLNHILKICII